MCARHGLKRPSLYPTRAEWMLYDLRYVRMLPDTTLQPLCPAVQRGISRAVIEIETDELLCEDF